MKYFDTKKDSLEEAISKAINEDNRPSAKELEEAGGKYLKYSDLLLQKGRLMQQGKNTAMIDKEISKEMKKLNIKEKMSFEGFASDAQRRAAFASGYKEKGKKKKEEVETSSKTVTGKKPTAVEIEPEVK